jgi:DNA repair ATPase RecN
VRIFTEAERARLIEIGAIEKKFGPEISRLRSVAQRIVTEIDDLDDAALGDEDRVWELGANAETAAKNILKIAAQLQKHPLKRTG